MQHGKPTVTCGRDGKVMEVERWGRRLQKEQKGREAWEEQELATDGAGEEPREWAAAGGAAGGPAPARDVLPARNPHVPPQGPSVGSGGCTPDLYSRKSEYTEKAPSTGPFL